MTVVRKRVGERDSTAVAGRGDPRVWRLGAGEHLRAGMFEVGWLGRPKARGVAGKTGGRGANLRRLASFAEILGHVQQKGKGIPRMVCPLEGKPLQPPVV